MPLPISAISWYLPLHVMCMYVRIGNDFDMAQSQSNKGKVSIIGRLVILQKGYYMYVLRYLQKQC